jgi:hypothetical protein
MLCSIVITKSNPKDDIIVIIIVKLTRMVPSSIPSHKLETELLQFCLTQRIRLAEMEPDIGNDYFFPNDWPLKI